MKEAYWDNYYSGYSPVGTYSVSQNCYGHAFGTGTFVMDGMYGAEIIRVDDWDDTDLYDAEVAYTESHAIKVTPKECFDEMTSWWILEASSEKNRCSAVYNQAEDCPDGVTLKDGPYEYYKKKTP